MQRILATKPRTHTHTPHARTMQVCVCICVCVCVVHHVQYARFIDLMLQCTYYPSSSQRQLIPWRCGAILHTQNDTDTHTRTNWHTHTDIHICSVAVCTLHAHTRIWALGCARKVGQVCAAGGSLAKPSGIGKCARVMLPTLGAPPSGPQQTHLASQSVHLGVL